MVGHAYKPILSTPLQDAFSMHVVYLNWDEPVDREMHSVTPSDLKDVK